MFLASKIEFPRGDWSKLVDLQNSGHAEDLLPGTFPFQSDVQGRKPLSSVCNSNLIVLE